MAAALPRPLLVALDVDGTLAPIVEDPAAARVPVGTQQLLRGLCGSPGVIVALVTGRDATQLARMIRLPAAYRALSHGRRLVAPGEAVPALGETPDERRALDGFAKWARSYAVPRGARVEDKRGARAVHVRDLAARDAVAAEGMLEQARREARRRHLHPRDGRQVVEAEIDAGDKGDALAEIAKRTDSVGVVYAGDDLTDLPAIRRAVALGGVGVFVRSKERRRAPHGATLVVDGPNGVALFLAALLEAL
jgi:trehalose 6-phosphate phosphatase